MKTLNYFVLVLFFLCGLTYSVAAQTTGENVVVGEGSGVNMIPLGGNRQVASVAIYKASEIQKTGSLNGVSWYATVASAVARKVTIYLKETEDSTLVVANWATVTAGLTPFHETADDWTNTTGWNTILFDSSFAYAGDKNLMLIVRTVGTTATPAAPNVYATQAFPYAHLRWTLGNANPITTNGSLDLLRPNVRLIFNMDQEEAPTANFLQSNNQPIFSENFDNSTSMPLDWESQMVTGGFNWTINVQTSSTTGYNIVNANNRYSVMLQPNLNAAQDAWLKSPSVDLPEESSLNFSILYAKKNGTQYAPVYLYISTDDGANWEQIWTTGYGTTTDINTSIWYKLSFDLSAYAYQSVRFAWRCYGPQYGGNWVALDEVSVTRADNGVLNVMEGESLQLTDRSSGHIDSWLWQLPGSESGTSTLQNPYVVYPQAGTYNVKLKVTNSFGSDSLESENIVHVIARTPRTAFKIKNSSGYTLKTNHGQFIPKGGEISFENASENAPTSFLWNFEGGTPSTSTQSKQIVQYLEKGTFDMDFTTTNNIGTSSITKEDYVKVGGKDSIWNMPERDSGSSVYYIETSPAKGYLTGQNVYKFLGYAEHFDKSVKGEISDILLNLMVGTKKNEVFQVQIRTEKSDGTPGAILAAVDLPVADMNTSGYTSVHFPTPVPIDRAFYVALWGFEDYSDHPTTVVIKTSLKQKSGGSVHFYDFRSNKWYAYAGAEGQQFGSPKISLNIVPILTYTELILNTEALSFEATGGNTSIPVNSNITWETFSVSSWLTVSKTANNISLTCSPNSGGYRSATVVVRGGGEEKHIQVTQKGNNPMLLSGQINTGNSDIKELSWTASPSGEASLLSWSNGKPQNGTYNSSNPIVAAVLWDPEDLNMYNSLKLTAVDFFITTSGNYTIKIFNGPALAHTQIVDNYVIGKNNHIVLTQPIVVDLSKGFRISCTAENYADLSFPVVYDSGVAVPYKGDLISIDGGTVFYSYADVMDPVQVGNWCISAVIEGVLKENFNVYRDEVKIASTITKTYNDNYHGGCSYKVASTLHDGSDGEVSNTVVLDEAYDPAELAALKAFLRQPSTIADVLNAHKVGISDTITWVNNTAWVSNLVGVTFTKVANINRVQKIVWSGKNLAGNLQLTPCIYLEILTFGESTVATANKITNLNITGCIALRELTCEINPLSSNIDLTTNVNLTFISLYNCGLTNLDITKNTKLLVVLCDYNNLTSLDVSKNVLMTSLTCNNNRIKALNLSANTALGPLIARDNQIETLILPPQNLTNLRIQNNKLKFSTLPNKTFVSYTYAPQAVIVGAARDFNAGINLSSEYQTTVNGNTATTTFTWYDITGDGEVAITEGITGNNGVFTLSVNTAGKKLRCKMTNSNFPNFTGNNVLVYEVQINEIRCHAPSNASVVMLYDGNCGAQVSWTAPSTGENEFNIYRNNVLIASNVAGTSYVDTDFSLGTHTWCIKSACNEEESILSTCATGTCAIPTYTITASTSVGGTITPTGAISAVYGSFKTFTFIAQTGYQLKEVLVDGTNVPEAVAAGSYTFENVTSNHTIVANFEKIPFIIAATAEAGGTITPTGDVTVLYGENQTFTITANPGNTIDQVLVDGVNNVAAVYSGSYTFINVRAEHTISATFVTAAYTITATAGTGGTVSPSGVTGANHGDNKTFFIVPNAGYVIAQVLVDGSPNSEAMSGVYTFTNISASHTIAATFEYSYSTIMATADEGGTIAPAGASQVSYGGSKFYSITPNVGYKIAQVLVDGMLNAAAVETGTYLFTNVTASHSIHATFTHKSYDISASCNDGGTISPTGTTTLNYGGSQVYAITTATGYTLTQVLIDGVSIGIPTTYPFSNVTENHSIRAIFEIKKYDITATAGAGGTIFPTGIITVNHGSGKAYSFHASEGYKLKEVLVDGANNAAAVTSGTYTFSNVTANHTITANFEAIQFTVTSSIEGANGSITPTGAQKVNYGDEISFTITPNEGYLIDKVLVDGINRPGAIASGEFAFSGVMKDHTIAASFTPKTNINEGDIASLTVYPNPTTGELKIMNGELRMNTILVFDITGKLLMERNNVDNTQTTIDISEFAQGIYFFNVDGKVVKVVKR